MEFKLVKLEETKLVTHTIDQFNNINTSVEVIDIKDIIDEFINTIRIFAEAEKCFVDLAPFRDIVRTRVTETRVVNIIEGGYLPRSISPLSNVHESLGTISDYLPYARQPHYWLKIINKYLENINSSTFINLTLDNLIALTVSHDISEIQPAAVDKDFFHGLLNTALKADVVEDAMPKHANSPVTLELAFKQSVLMLIDEFLPSNSYSDKITESMKLLEAQLKPFIDLDIALRSRNHSRGTNYGHRYVGERPTRSYGDDKSPNPTPSRFGPSNYGNSRREHNPNRDSSFWSLDTNHEPLPNKKDIKQYLEFLKADVETALTMLDKDTSEPEWNRTVNSLTHSCSSVANWFKQRGK